MLFWKIIAERSCNIKFGFNITLISLTRGQLNIINQPVETERSRQQQV